jgi:hypothetical protein
MYHEPEASAANGQEAIVIMRRDFELGPMCSILSLSVPLLLSVQWLAMTGMFFDRFVVQS